MTGRAFYACIQDCASSSVVTCDLPVSLSIGDGRALQSCIEAFRTELINSAFIAGVLGTTEILKCRSN